MTIIFVNQFSFTNCQIQPYINQVIMLSKQKLQNKILQSIKFWRSGCETSLEDVEDLPNDY